MSDKPLISVIVPARNEEKYLGKCLEALSKQDYPNYEIVVIDNASSDSTSEIARRFTNRVFREEKIGLSYARNSGFKEARGEIIARTDADSMPPPAWLTELNKVFENDPKVVAVGGSDEFNDKGKLIQYFSRIFFWILFYATKVILGHYQLSGPNFAVRKSALIGIKPHMEDNKIHEDMEIACHIKEKGKIVFKPLLIMPISGRKLKSDPGHLVKYFKKSIYTYLLHHPSHKLHNVR
jgi:glycosyltransferase involved in cell wall biosynthesis